MPGRSGARARSTRLNGMFAFAIWDDERRASRSRATRSARSRCSSRRADRTLVFASDIARILAVGPELGVRTPMRAGALPRLRGCMPAMARELLRRHRTACPALTCCACRRPHCRAALLDATSRPTFRRRYEDAVGELRELLGDSIALRLRSDVPVGTSLSGGVDSSAIVGARGADRAAITPACVHCALPRLRARRVALRRGGRARRRRDRAPRRRADCRRAARRPRAAHRSTRRSRSAAPASTPSGA